MRYLIVLAILIGCVGPKGDKGDMGSPGAPSTPGTVITPTQFCPGTPTYPSTFPEVGFCINNTMYAVYSTNGGFMTSLPDGRYESNAVGSRCTFTITNCVVSY